MEVTVRNIMNFLLKLILVFLVQLLLASKKVEGQYSTYSNSLKLLQNLAQFALADTTTGTGGTKYPVLRPRPPPNQTGSISKVVFPFPEDVELRSYLPDLGFLTDLAFLFFLPRNLPTSGMVRLSRELFESEQCVQYVSCEMTKVAQRHNSLDWIHNFLQDFPFQGDVAERLRQGSMDAISKIKKRETTAEGNGTSTVNSNQNNNAGRRRQDENDICTFSCHPLTSLSKGLQILGLLHELVRTVK